MAISYVGGGATSNTTTQNYPATVTAGELLILTLVSKIAPNYPVAPNGWTLLSQDSGGTGSGDGAGAVTVTNYYQIAQGTESAGTFTITTTGVNVFFGRVSNFSKAADKDWDLAYGTGSFTTAASTAWSVATSAVSMAANDFVFAVSGLSLATASCSAQGFSSAGITFGSILERSDSGTSGGNDVRLVLASAAITAGTATQAITYTQTTLNATTGQTTIIRLREVTPAAPTITSARMGASMGFYI
jgi:hypothetical protein